MHIDFNKKNIIKLVNNTNHGYEQDKAKTNIYKIF